MKTLYDCFLGDSCCSEGLNGKWIICNPPVSRTLFPFHVLWLSWHCASELGERLRMVSQSSGRRVGSVGRGALPPPGFFDFVEALFEAVAAGLLRRRDKMLMCPAEWVKSVFV